ncbi:MAG: MFS transporter [bacterium]|nr:MFS transporter [bacterium]
MKLTEERRTILAWAMYDWANSAFATTVIAGFFPIFFKQYWSAGADVTMSTLRLGMANSIASIVVAVLSPFLGAVADRGGLKIKFLAVFAAMGIVMTGALHFVARGEWELAVLVYVIASIGFSASTIFYDSLLVSVTGDKRSDFVSSLGYALGYIGGGILFAFNVAMTLRPELFGLADAAQAVRVSFVTVAIWWAVFTIPILIWVKEPPGEHVRGWNAITAGVRQLRSTMAELRKLKIIMLFLFGYWLYIDGVQTLARMAVDYGLSLGFSSDKLIVALLIVQFVGFPASIGFGLFGEKVGTRRGLYVGIAVYIVVCIYAYRMTNVSQMFYLAAAIGLVQGGVQSLSRSLYSRMIPRSKAAGFFGFYNMVGKFGTVVGPVLMGWVAVATGSSRLSMLSLIVLLVAGAAFLPFVNEERARHAARELENG